MKFNKILPLFIILQVLIFAAHSFAMDTDLYIDQQSTIEPNILIIFDKSGSMNSPPVWNKYCSFKPSTTYDPIPGKTLDVGVVYRQTKSNWASYTQFKSSISGVGCSLARGGLTGSGQYYGNTNPAGSPKTSDKECTKEPYTLATGNYLRWYFAVNSDNDPCPTKLEIAKKVIKDFIGTINNVRIGIMVFKDTFDQSDNVWCSWGPPCPEAEGGRILNEIVSVTENQTNRDALKSKIDSIWGGGYTPLAETLYEAGLYYQGVASYFNSGTTYASPIQYYCQKNYVILMTDGMSTCDRNAILQSIGTNGDTNADQKEPPGAPNDPGYDDSYGSHFLDDVAKYIYDSDLHTMQGKQNVVTYTIGFEIDGGDPSGEAKKLLQEAATLGHGKFYPTSGAGGLEDAFANIVNEVLAKTSSFVAPIVPVSKMEKTTAGDKIYLAFFRPNQSGMWSGNIKKYGVQQTNSGSLAVGDILDVSGSKAADENGAFYPSSKSFWTTASSDGGEVQVGGVGELLQNRTEARNIYTILPGTDSDLDKAPPGDSDTFFDLTNAKNAFTTANTYLTKEKLGLSDDNARNPLINFVRGIDAYDDNMNGQTTDKRDWMLGSFLHSRPFVINYGPNPSDPTVIYAGANDGMLHAFRDSDGEELWAFIPPNLLGRLKELHTETPGIFVDGSPKAYVTYDGSGNVTQAILIFGLRRGGNYYYALDVTNPTVPKYLWRIYKGKNGNFNQIGQTWSTPVIAKIPYGSQTTNPPGSKWVAIFGAGYDDEMDMANPDVNNIDTGRGMYLADVLTGAYVWGKSHFGGYTTMTYPIPSDFATIDVNGDGMIDRLYVGDTNARMFRFDIGDLNKSGNSDPDEWTVKMIFKANPTGTEKTRMFYPPDVTFEKDSTGEYEMLFFGTGDREDPKGTKDIDFIYAFKDKDASTTKGKSDLVDVSDFYSLNADGQTAKLNEIKSGLGWYIKMEKKSGEKVLSTPVVYAKTAYFTSFSPSTEAIDDPCFIGEGTASLYAVNWSTGEAAFNLDDPTNLGIGARPSSKSDRTKIIGSAIPSGVVITVIGGKVVAYIGVGGGVVKPPTPGTKSLFPMTWKLVF